MEPAQPTLDNPVPVLTTALSRLARNPEHTVLALNEAETEALRQAIAMLAAKDTSVSLSSAGLAVQLDLPTMLNTIDPGGRWLGYDPDEDEDRYQSASLAALIVDAAAGLLVKRLGRSVDTAVGDAVTTTATEMVEGYVREALETGTLQPMTEFGSPKGEARPLLDVIRQSASDFVSKQVGDSFGRNGRQTALTKLVDEAVGKAFKSELTKVVDDARNAAKIAVRDSAAEVIKETIERATRGL